MAKKVFAWRLLASLARNQNPEACRFGNAGISQANER